jgi:hypothetical protein
MWGFRKRTADFVIAPQGETVMNRWFLIPRNRWFNIYLHRLDGADPQSVHDHPWWNLSIMLKGRRAESMPVHPLPNREAEQWAHPVAKNYSAWKRERASANYQNLRAVVRNPGSLVFRRATDAHRLQTLGGPSYSLFITGPVVREWGFWLPTGWVSYKEHVEVIDGVSRQKV